jgi:hypothetical protein
MPGKVLTLNCRLILRTAITLQARTRKIPGVRALCAAFRISQDLSSSSHASPSRLRHQLPLDFADCNHPASKDPQNPWSACALRRLSNQPRLQLSTYVSPSRLCHQLPLDFADCNHLASIDPQNPWSACALRRLSNQPGFQLFTSCITLETVPSTAA